MKEILSHIESDDDFRVTSFISILAMMLSEKPNAQGMLIVRRHRDVAQGTGALLSPNDWALGGQYTASTVLTMYTDLLCFRFWFRPQTPRSARYTLYPPASLHIERTNPQTLPAGYCCSGILLWCSDPAFSDPPAASGIPDSPCTVPLFYGWNIRPSYRHTPVL